MEKSNIFILLTRVPRWSLNDMVYAHFKKLSNHVLVDTWNHGNHFKNAKLVSIWLIYQDIYGIYLSCLVLILKIMISEITYGKEICWRIIFDATRISTNPNILYQGKTSPKLKDCKILICLIFGYLYFGFN